MNREQIAARAKQLALEIDENGRQLGKVFVNRPLPIRAKTGTCPSELDKAEHSIELINDHYYDAWLIHRLSGGDVPFNNRLYLSTGLGVYVKFRHGLSPVTHFWVKDPYVRTSGYGLRLGELGIQELEWILSRIETMMNPRRATKKLSAYS